LRVSIKSNTDIEIVPSQIEKGDNSFARFEDEKYLWIAEGVSVGSPITLEKVLQCVQEDGIQQIQRIFKGAFAVVLYIKDEKRIFVANDRLSKKAVYYYHTDDRIVVDTSFFGLCACLREAGVQPEVCWDAVEAMCRNGVFTEDICYEKSTRYLLPYCALDIDLQAMDVKVLSLPVPAMKKQGAVSEQDAMDTIEQLFKNACELQWQLNEKKKADQIITLSGGMDSRAVFLHLPQKEKMVAYTYAQTASLDEGIAKRLAEKKGVESRFIPLDTCEFLFRREDILEASEGQMHYTGTTGAILMAEDVAVNCRAEIVHTGLGGGEIFGDICREEWDGQIIPHGPLCIERNQWANLNDLRTCLAFQKVTRGAFQAMSPFLDEDFFEFILCLPTQMKTNRKLYDRWYLRFMDTSLPITGARSRIGRGKWKTFGKRVLNKLARQLGIKTKNDMNPFSYWYKKDSRIGEYMEEKYQKDIGLLENSGVDTSLFQQYWKNDAIARGRTLTATYTILRMLGIVAAEH